MNISQIMEKMIAFSNGNLHDMNHLMCVWTYAKTIGELEGLKIVIIETPKSGKFSCLAAFLVGDIFSVLLIQAHIF